MQLLSYFVVRRETAPIISYSNPQRSNSRVKGEKYNRRLTIAENSGASNEIFKLYVKLAIVKLALSKSASVGIVDQQTTMLTFFVINVFII